MTLSTSIYFPDSVYPKDVFYIVRRLLKAGDNVPVLYENGFPRHKTGMGLDAWILTEPISELEGLEDVIEMLGETPYFIFNMDTSYGYNKKGYTCEDLHAGIILQISLFSSQFVWENEFTGERFKGSQKNELFILGNPYCFGIWDTLFN